jgi:3-hydroxyacyl-[acyl-carrier-protein] dehydratase
MLLDSFYTITEKGEKNDVNVPADKPVRKFTFTLKLNPSHPVYEGHFPGNPVVPGVCQVQMVKELTSEILNTKLLIQRSDNIKFLSAIIPAIYPILKVSIDIMENEPGLWHVYSVISNEDQVFLKFKGVMRPE